MLSSQLTTCRTLTQSITCKINKKTTRKRRIVKILAISFPPTTQKRGTLSAALNILQNKNKKHIISFYTTEERAAGGLGNISATKQTTTWNQSWTKPSLDRFFPHFRVRLLNRMKKGVAVTNWGSHILDESSNCIWVHLRQAGNSNAVWAGFSTGHSSSGGGVWVWQPHRGGKRERKDIIAQQIG